MLHRRALQNNWVSICCNSDATQLWNQPAFEGGEMLHHSHLQNDGLVVNVCDIGDATH